LYTLSILITRPSNKIIALLAIVILIVGAVAYNQFFGSKNTSNNGILSYSTSADDASTTAGINSDGTFAISPDSAFANSDYFSSTDNLTDRFAKTAFATYIDLQNSGASDADAQTETVGSLATQASDVANTDAYSLSDIKTFSGHDSAALHAYGNSYVSIQENNLAVISNDTAKYNNDLSAIADVYDTISTQLLALAAPADIANIHLETVNDYHNIALDFRDLDSYSNDPLKALAAVQQITDLESAEATSSAELSAYFKANGIIFSSNESGYTLNSN